MKFVKYWRIGEKKPCQRRRGEHTEPWSSYEPFLWRTMGRWVKLRQLNKKPPVDKRQKAVYNANRPPDVPRVALSPEAHGKIEGRAIVRTIVAALVVYHSFAGMSRGQKNLLSRR